MQSLPLEAKIIKTQQRIREWYEHWHGEVYVSFSGGKDSTVLLHLVRDLYPDVPAVFVDTGLEYPEIREFVKTIENVETIRPKMPFKQVIEKHGYPVATKEQAHYLKQIRLYPDTANVKRILSGYMPDGSKASYKLSEMWKKLINAPFKVSDRCCDVMKKSPIFKYERETKRKSFVGTMAYESHKREQNYMKTGCNSFDSKRPKSVPLSFWTESNVWQYLKTKQVPYSKIYDMGYERTGCMFCMFGVHLERGLNRFQKMQKTHPKQYDYCINKLGLGGVLDFIGVDYVEKQTNLIDYIESLGG